MRPARHWRPPRHRDANRPFSEAIAGLIACYEALGKPAEAAELKALADRLSGDGARRG